MFFFASFYPLRCDNRLLSKCAITCTPKGERTTNAFNENLHSNILPFIWLVAINWLCGWRSIERFSYKFNTGKFYFNLFFFFVWLSFELIKGKMCEKIYKNIKTYQYDILSPTLYQISNKKKLLKFSDDGRNFEKFV